MATNDVLARESAINTAASAADTSNSNEIQGDCVKRTAWKSTVSAWFVAKAAYAAHPYTRTTADHPDYARLEQEASGLSDAEGAALDAIMETPAPDHAAVMEKMEILKAELLLSDGHYADLLVADLRRLRDRTVWDGLMARYLVAKSEEDAYARRVHDPMFEDSPYSDTDERKAISDEMERLTGIRCDLQGELLGATAPDRSALLWKLEWLLNDRDNMCWSDATIDPIQSDVRRILGGEA